MFYHLRNNVFPYLLHFICSLSAASDSSKTALNVLPQDTITIAHCAKNVEEKDIKTGFRCSLPMALGVKMSDFEASKKRNATTGKVKNIF